MPNPSKDFKLLAIRIRNNCDRKYCSNLQYEQLYQFYSSFQFDATDKQPTNIKQTNSDFGLFNAFTSKEQQLQINVSAIVGKNGSGKSTLTELLFLCCYLIAERNGVLIINENNNAGIREKDQLNEIKEGLKIEVYYQVDDLYKCVVMDKGFTIAQTTKSNIQFIDLFKGDEMHLKDFFYSIGLNYSIYGLNEQLTGNWVGRLFHKNDGYRTPVVINPFRDRGRINSIGEIHFAQTRLLTNLMLNYADKGELIPGKPVAQVAFVIDKAKIARPEDHALERIIEELEKANYKTIKDIFDQTYKTLLGVDVKDARILDSEWQNYTINYVIAKLIRIAKNYPEYKDYFERYSDEEVPGFHNIDAFLDALKIDHTHITLKLRQALNFYREDPLRLDDEQITSNGKRVTIPIGLLVKRFKKMVDDHPDEDPATFIPVAPFTPRFIIEGNVKFQRLSSGEQQYIHSIQAIVYHILNLNSVFKSVSDSPKITYDCINIVLDEIELYFHPEFQRTFLYDLLKTLSVLKIPHIAGINILFLTHSPFILSDIPAVNVLRLNKGFVAEGRPLTFAGNIHQMLSDSFFMDATTGEFARYQYQQILDFYDLVRRGNTDQDYEFKKSYLTIRDKYQFIVEQIGEDVIKGVLENHLRFLDERLLPELINQMTSMERIEAEIAVLTQKLKDLNDQNKLS